MANQTSWKDKDGMKEIFRMVTKTDTKKVDNKH